MVYAEITRDMARLGNDETRIQHYHFEYSPPPVSRHKGEHLAIHESRWYISIMQPERL
jgi:hypothetical protein